MSFSNQFVQVLIGSTADWNAQDKIIPAGWLGRNSDTKETRVGTGLAFSASQLLVAPVDERVLAVPVNSTSTTRATIAGTTVNVVAGRRYRIEVHALFQTVALTTGGSMGVVMPTGTGTIIGHMRAGITQATGGTAVEAPIRAIDSSSTTAGSFMSSPSVAPINAPHHWYATMVLTCTVTGTFALQWGTEVNASEARLLAGSTMTVTLLN